jgi:hypothetical protein
MKKLPGSRLVSLVVFLAGPSFVAAGEHCRHPDCGRVCRVSAPGSHRHVPEVCYREIKFTVRKPRCQTELALEKSQLVKPTYEPVVEPGCAIVSIPVCHHETCVEVCRELVPETTLKTVTLDNGSWCTVHRKCFHLGPKSCETVWVPNCVETCVPSTEMVSRDVLVPKTHETCHEEPTPISFPIHSIARRFEKEDVYRHVPVTTEKWVEEEVVIRVPFVTSRCVSCRQEFESDDDLPAADLWRGDERAGAPHRAPRTEAAPTAPFLISPTPQGSRQSAPQPPLRRAMPELDL